MLPRGPVDRPLPSLLVGLALTAIVALGLALRLYRLDERSLWVDELQTYYVARVSPAELPGVLAFDFNMSLYYLLMRGLYPPVSASLEEAGLRWPSVLFSTLTIPVVFAAGRIAHSSRAGLLAALIFAVHLFAIGQAQEARSYALFALLSAASWLCLLTYLRRRRPGQLVASVALAVTSLYASYYAVFSTAAQLAVLAWLLPAGKRRPLALAMLGHALGVLPIIAVVLLVRRGDTSPFLGWLQPLNEKYLDWVVEPLIGQIGIGLVVSYLALGAALLVVSRSGPTCVATRAALAWALGPTIALVGLGFLVPIVTARYMIFVVPALSVAIGLGLAALPTWQAGLGLLALAAGAVGPLQAGAYNLWDIQEDWQGAVRYAATTAQPGDGWLFVPPLGRYALEFYVERGAGRPPRFLDALTGEPLGELTTRRLDPHGCQDERGQQFQPRSDTLWLVLRTQCEPFAADLRRRLRNEGFAEQRREFKFVQVIRFRRERA